jgi:hypothetical protein
MKSPSVEYWSRPSGALPNIATRIVPVMEAKLSPNLRRLFVGAYPLFNAVCRAVDEPGVALVAIDEATGAIAGMACIRAQVDRYVSAIVGRHSQCDLVIAGDDRLALRQLAVVVAPVRVWDAGTTEIGFRILDLRTTGGMLDEHGRRLRGLRAEGPAMIRCAGHAIYALPLGDSTDWPESAEDAWAFLPERVYFDELERVPEASVMRRPIADRAHNITAVTRLRGPLDAEMQLLNGRDLAGWLNIQGAWAQGTIEIGHQALRHGVLVGRYARCAGNGRFADDSMSRVHALLLIVDDRLHLIDVASTNGSREVGRSDARIIELVGNVEIELGFHTRVRWCWSS